MAFTATPNIVGVPSFGLIHIDPEEVAKAFQAYLDTASKLTGVSLDDISTSVIQEPNDPSKATLAELLGLGMKLFDAVVWLTAGRPSTHPLKEDPTMTKDKVRSLHDVARAVFFCYFMLVTQARYPVSKAATDKPKIPNFLRSIMGMEKEQHEYVETVCTFEPQKFDPAWARYVKFKNFGQETLSRFGLGVAGYRMFGPFGLYPPKSNIDKGLLPAFEFAKNVAKSPASWDVHPLTRNPNILARRGNLNKNLSNLILESFEEDKIAEMVAAKVIYGYPKAEPTHKNYKQWEAEDDVSGTHLIF